jgi:hypothetical protein
MQDFLCDYQPWRSHLQRAHAPVFEANLAEVNAEKERLAIKPSEMTDGEYMSQCAALKKTEEKAKNDIVRELTKTHFEELSDS